MTQTAPLSVFVTGATGALGREVTRQSKAAGFRVTGATNGYENAALVRADGGIPAYPDVMRSGELRSVIQASKAEIVVNCAPQLANHLPQVRGTAYDARLVDEGVSALLEAAQAAGVKYVVHTSYAFADADSEALDRLIEAVKAGEEKVLHGSIPASVLRLGFVYGAGSPELVSARDTLLQGRPVDCGPSNTHAAWTNAPDAARAVLQAIQQRATGRYTIVEDELASPAEFLGYFAESQGMSRPGHASRFAVGAQPTKEQLALMSLNPHVSGVEAKDKLGWQPRFPNYRLGIDDVLLSWRAVVEA
jgi:nucleoside-diphosphate-sugar epimerase